MQVIQTEQHLHKPVDNQRLFKQLPFLFPFLDIHWQISKFAILHDHDKDLIFQVMFLEFENVFVIEFLMDLGLLEGLLLLLLGHSLELYFFSYEFLIRFAMNDQVDSTVVATTD